MSVPRFKCPKCQSTDLRVEITTVAVLLQDPDGNLQTSIESDHDWNGQSTMMCANCTKIAAADDFDTEKEIEVEPI